MFRPHLHCVVPGGRLSADGQRWVRCRARFFLSVRVLSRLFRRLFLERIEKAFNSGKLQFFASLESLRDPRAFAARIAAAKEYEWVVYAKHPFAGPQQVLDYVGRYTHRVAISNNRLIDIGNDRVKFHWKDYRDNSKIKIMDLETVEFIRRFLLHVDRQTIDYVFVALHSVVIVAIISTASTFIRGLALILGCRWWQAIVVAILAAVLLVIVFVPAALVVFPYVLGK